MTLMPCSNAARIVETDSVSSVPPHIHPPMAQVPIATRDILIPVPGMSANSFRIRRVSSCWIMVLLPVHVLGAGCENQARFLSGDQAEGGPIEIGIAARD